MFTIENIISNSLNEKYKYVNEVNPDHIIKTFHYVT